MHYRNEEDYWNDYYDAQAEAERKAQEAAEDAADLEEFDTEEERDDYIQQEFAAEFDRRMAEIDRYFRDCKKGR